MPMFEHNDVSECYILSDKFFAWRIQPLMHLNPLAIVIEQTAYSN